MTDDQNPLGWLRVRVKQETEDRAKQMRIERDKKYSNIYQERATDERWVGDLGEIVLDYWMALKSDIDFKWITEDAAGEPDFVTSTGVRIGAKTVKRKVSPKPDYTAQITARHAEEPIDQFFFMTYHTQERHMWLLGGISKKVFLQSARYYGAGEWVHPNYQVRPGHEIYNIGIANLTTPGKWLQTLLQSA